VRRCGWGEGEKRWGMKKRGDGGCKRGDGPEAPGEEKN